MMEQLLADAGIRGDAIDAVKRVDALLQQWRRRMTRRELGHRAIARLGLNIEMAQLDVLFAIAAPEHEFGDGTAETMVGTVAERLAIDPSRASRLVAEMVTAGYARRAVSQADARRAVLVLTPSGEAVVRAVQAYKWLFMGEFFSGWSEEEIALFVPLLERFTDWTDATRDEARFAGEIEKLSAAIPASAEAHTEAS